MAVTANRQDLTDHERHVLEQRNLTRVRTAIEAGEIDVYWADEVACEVLRMHPSQIWGEAWFNVPPEVERTCPMCSVSIEHRHHTAVYCGQACTKRAERARKRAVAA